MKLSVQPLRPPDGTEGPHVSKAEGNAEGVLITHAGYVRPRKLERYSAAIPVVVGLDGRALNIRGLGVDGYADSATQARPVDGAVVHTNAVLVVDAVCHLPGRRYGAL